MIQYICIYIYVFDISIKLVFFLFVIFFFSFHIFITIIGYFRTANNFKCNFYLGYVQHIRTIRDPCLKLYYACPVYISTSSFLLGILINVCMCACTCMNVFLTHAYHNRNARMRMFYMYANAYMFCISCDMLQIFRNISRGTSRAILVLRLQQNYMKTMQSAASFSINILIRQLSKNDTNIDDC